MTFRSALFSIGCGVFAVGCGSDAPGAGADHPTDSGPASTASATRAEGSTIDATAASAVDAAGSSAVDAAESSAVDAAESSAVDAAESSAVDAALADSSTQGDAGEASSAVDATSEVTPPAGAFQVPYMGVATPAMQASKVGSRIKQVDLALVIDTTASMEPDIASLKAALTNTIVPNVASAIPDVGVGFIDVKDCGDVSWAFREISEISTSTAKQQSSVLLLSASGGGDEPESQLGGMQYALTGEALTGCAGVPAAHVPALGKIGGIDFRPDAQKIVALVTDAHWHSPNGSATMTTLKTAFNGVGAKFIDLLDVHGMTAIADLEDLANELSDATRSNVPAASFAGCAAGMCCTGLAGAARPALGPGGTCRLDFLVNEGAGLAAGVVSAVQALSVGTSFDVGTRVVNGTANADGVDASQFVAAVRAVDQGDLAAGCPPHSAVDTDGDGIKDTFRSVVVGTPLCFEVRPKTNTTVMPKTALQIFTADLKVVGLPGDVLLDRRTLSFVVPP